MILFLILLIPLSLPYKFTCINQKWRKQPRLYLNNREVLAPTAHNFSLIVDPTDQVVSNSILQTGSWQAQLLVLIAEMVENGDYVLNLGSQTGLQAVLMGKLVGETGKLVLFEPYSVSYKIVVKNLQINALSEMSTVYKMGAGREKQTLQLWIDEQNTGHSTFVSDGLGSAFEWIQVDAVDNILGNVVVDFALIDVEMFQVEALLGMKQVITGSPSFKALIQWRYLSNPRRNQTNTQGLLDWLQRQGFRWFRYDAKEGKCEKGKLEVVNKEDLLNIKEEDLLLAKNIKYV